MGENSYYLIREDLKHLSFKLKFVQPFHNVFSLYDAVVDVSLCNGSCWLIDVAAFIECCQGSIDIGLQNIIFTPYKEGMCLVT